MKPSLAILALFLPAALFAADGRATGRPNIIVILTDDHGFADLGIQGSVADVRTPNLDALARGGVLAKQGYSTAPQCVPSRAGLLVGKFQGRFRVDHNGDALDGFNRETTIAGRLLEKGYATAQFGKWHLGADSEIPQHGFKHVFAHAGQPGFFSNITLDGADRPMGRSPVEIYHIDGCSRAAASVIARYRNDPFFLYLAYRAPHTPLDAPPSYTGRFPGEMPERRRQALGMISAIDEGVGLITATLGKYGLTEKTLVFVIGDNGAPLKIHKEDAPLNADPGGWDGSLNDPLNGEKGMLAEGGMHVPFIISWPGTIPGGQTYGQPISSLDVAATAAALAGIDTKPGDLDGINLVPYLTDAIKTPPHEALYWRWIAQSAIREGDWKLLRGGDREYLYNLATDLGEKTNLASRHPEIASRLRTRLTAWAATLDPPGLTNGAMAPTWNDYFDHYLDGRTLADTPGGGKKSGKGGSTVAGNQSWEARNGTLTVKDGVLELVPEKGAKGAAPFLTKSRLSLTGPFRAKFELKSSAAGDGGISWRTGEQKDFLPANRVTFAVPGGDAWSTHSIEVPAGGKVVHVRLNLTGGRSLVRNLVLEAATK